MSEQNESDEPSIFRKNIGVAMRHSVPKFLLRPKSLNVHPEAKITQSLCLEEDSLPNIGQSRTPDLSKRGRKVSSVIRPNLNSLAVPSTHDGPSDFIITKAILESQTSRDETEPEEEFDDVMEQMPLEEEFNCISLPPIPSMGSSTRTLTAIEEEECCPYLSCSQIFADDINRAMDLVLQDNGRTLEEKRRDINKIKYELNALRSSVSMNMQLVLLSDLWSLDDPMEEVEKPVKKSQISTIRMRGMSMMQMN